METLEVILTRRSVRAYHQQPVPAGMIEKLLAAAMQALSAGNQQPWHFIVVTDQEQIDALVAVLPRGQCLKEAPLAIAICGDLEHAKHVDFWVQDCSAATQNLLLAAHDLGLGAVWLGIYPREERVADVSRVLGLPNAIVPLCLISIGYPADKLERPETRYDKFRVHHNHW